MEQKITRPNQQFVALTISLIIHLVVLSLLLLLPDSQTYRQFTEVVVLLDPPLPRSLAQDDQELELLSPPVEDQALPEEIALPAESQPEIVPITPVAPTPVPPVPVPVAPAPSAPQPVTRTSTVSPVPQSRVPTDEELLADVQGLMSSSRSQPISPITSTTSPNLSGFVSPQDSTQSQAEAQAFQQANPVSGPISQETFTPQQQTQSVASSDPQQALAVLRAQMNQQYNQQADRPGTTSTQTSGFTDPRIQGNLGNRGLVSADRLNLSRHIQQRGSNWPDSISVRFEVDESGFSRILNEADFSLYSDLALAVFRLFVQDGQMFVAAPGTTRQQGSITFRLQ